MRKGDFRIRLGQEDFKAPDLHQKKTTPPLNCGTSSDFASSSLLKTSVVELNCILVLDY